MVMGYQEVVKRYGSVYQITKAIGQSKLFKIGRGIYSESSTSSEIEIIAARYPQAIFTMDSAFYFHGLTDVTGIIDSRQKALIGKSWRHTWSRQCEFLIKIVLIIENILREDCGLHRRRRVF